MKIGIGVITAGIRSIHPNIPGRCDPHAVIHVQTDHERAGPAKTRNACFRALLNQGCEHVFMFDDDCYPTVPGWEKYFIEHHAATGIEFFGLPEAFKGRLLSLNGETARWDGIVGCFSSQSRRFLDIVGGYNMAYVRYGSEDIARNARALRSGLCGQGPGFPSLLRAPSYIHSMDVYAENPAPNLSAEEKREYIDLNRPVYEAEISSGQLYYPFE